MKIPQVPIAAAKHYADSWHLGGMGVKPLLDETTLKFATEWANVCIKDPLALLPVRQTATPVGNPRIEKAESGRCRSNACRTASDTKKFNNLNRLRSYAKVAFEDNGDINIPRKSDSVARIENTQRYDS